MKGTTLAAWLLPLLIPAPALAAPDNLGRLFHTPAQRAQLEHARAHNITQPGTKRQGSTPAVAPAPRPLRFDGVVIRSDGTSTRWVNGKAEVGISSVPGLKPGQIRAGGKVYEPYQVLRPAPALPDRQEPAP